jgi:hypothetical protein
MAHRSERETGKERPEPTLFSPLSAALGYVTIV